MAQNETLNGYLNILPTTYGDTRLMKSTTELNIAVSVLNNEVEQDIILLKKVKVKDLEDTLNLRDSRVYDTIEEDGKEKRVLNETTLAQQKQQ